MAIDWFNPTNEMLAGLEAGRQESSDTIDQHLLTISTLEGAHTSLQTSISKLTTQRNELLAALKRIRSALDGLSGLGAFATEANRIAAFVIRKAEKGGAQ